MALSLVRRGKRASGRAERDREGARARAGEIERVPALWVGARKTTRGMARSMLGRAEREEDGPRGRKEGREGGWGRLGRLGFGPGGRKRFKLFSDFGNLNSNEFKVW